MRQQSERRSGQLVMAVLLLTLIAAAVIFVMLSDEPDTEVVLPTSPPITPTEQPPTATPSITPTLTQTPPPSATPSPTPNTVIEFSTIPPTQEPNTPSPSIAANTPAPEAPALPALPAPVEIALNIPIPGVSDVAPTYGRFGGLYDNAELIANGHIMVAVPDNPQPFYIDVFEVTNIQMVNYLNASTLTDSSETWNGQPIQWINTAGSLFQNELGVWAARNQGDLLPVHGVSALAARAYCANIGGTLPSLDQWRRAAFWDESQTPRPYPWGSAAPDRTHVNFAGEAPMLGNGLSKGQSWVGTFHMAGNVAEWVILGENRFGIIGGSFLDDPTSFEQAIQSATPIPAGEAPLGAGFRCVRNG